MKNQYYGDINDYKKYAYLRFLVKNGDFQLGINWYLTKDDGTNHGNKIEYLDEPKKWQKHDPDLFKNLHDSVKVRRSRSVSNASKDLELGSKVCFFDKNTPHTSELRESWVRQAMSALKNWNLIFLDPDNGLSVKSVPLGRAESSKYVFDEELKQFASGRSLIFYQHFPMQVRELFIHECCQRVSKITGNRSITTLKTSDVLFVVVPDEKHREKIREMTGNFAERWGKDIKFSEWRSTQQIPLNNDTQQHKKETIKMKYLIIYAHPNPASFNHAIMETISEQLKKNNKDFTVRDLYQMNFNPVLKAEDLTAFQNGSVPHDIKTEQDLIRLADMLIFVFPIWWSSMPAILKGYIDRVFSLKFAYDITGNGIVGLLKGKKVFIVSTTGASKEDYEKMGAFKMMNMSMDGAIFQSCGMEAIGHKYFSSVPNISDQDRKQMLEEVRLLVGEKVL